MIHNTYLPSFAYNLFLCWLYVAGKETPDVVALRCDLLRHNFKKFFAEQLIHPESQVYSRALFLETLLFEQRLMVPVFEARKQDPELDGRAQAASGLMSLILSLHELGHFFFGSKPGAWEVFVEGHHDILMPILARVSKTYPRQFLEEFQCDAYAILSCARIYGETSGIQFSVRAIAFAFAAFAVLFSLSRSARKTVEDHTGTPDQVDLRSLEKKHYDFAISLGVDRDFSARVQLAIELCEAIATRQGFALFGDDRPFQLPHTIADDLLRFIDVILDSDDKNARDMSLLVAEALHGHEKGFQYLYLRSKTFTTNRAGKLEV